MNEPQALRVIAPPPLIFLAGLVTGALLDRILPLGPGYGALFIGLLLSLTGASIAWWAVASFHRARTTILPYGTARYLVPEGPYRYTRNPMYLGMLVAYVGLPVALGSWWSFLLLPIVLAVLHWAWSGLRKPTSKRASGRSTSRTRSACAGGCKAALAPPHV